MLNNLTLNTIRAEQGKIDTYQIIEDEGIWFNETLGKVTFTDIQDNEGKFCFLQSSFCD